MLDWPEDGQRSVGREPGEGREEAEEGSPERSTEYQKAVPKCSTIVCRRRLLWLRKDGTRSSAEQPQDLHNRNDHISFFNP